MKKNEELKNTTNTTVYRRSYYKRFLSCTKCPPNRGCNRSRKHKLQPYRSWKTYRETQWK